MHKPTLYILVNDAHINLHGVAISLQTACIRQGIPYEFLVVENISLDQIADMKFARGSLLYRVSTRAKAATIESMLVLLHPGIFTTIYRPKTLPLSSRPFRELCEQISAGLPIIPTRIVDETWQHKDTKELTEKVNSLGGFPIIIKTLGLSHGQGVRKAEAVNELQAILAQTDFNENSIILRKYLAHYRHYRLIVINNKAVAAIEYHVPADDFRTNASEEPQVSAVKLADLDKTVIAIAIEGVHLRASILGGVDILVDQSDNSLYLAEVNVPCYFTRAETPTGIDISGQLITAMLTKREKELA